MHIFRGTTDRQTPSRDHGQWGSVISGAAFSTSLRLLSALLPATLRSGVFLSSPFDAPKPCRLAALLAAIPLEGVPRLEGRRAAAFQQAAPWSRRRCLLALAPRLFPRLLRGILIWADGSLSSRKAKSRSGVDVSLRGALPTPIITQAAPHCTLPLDGWTTSRAAPIPESTTSRHHHGSLRAPLTSSSCADSHATKPTARTHPGGAVLASTEGSRRAEWTDWGCFARGPAYLEAAIAVARDQSPIPSSPK